MRNWPKERFGVALLGLASVTIGALIPATTGILIPAGMYFLGVATLTPGNGNGKHLVPAVAPIPPGPVEPVDTGKTVPSRGKR